MLQYHDLDCGNILIYEVATGSRRTDNISPGSVSNVTFVTEIYAHNLEPSERPKHLDYVNLRWIPD